MLWKDKITSIFCIIDDILKEINHSEDIRRKVSDSEIITIAFYFTVGKTAEKMFPRTIHSVTLKGFLIKITMYIFGLQLFKIINN